METRPKLTIPYRIYGVIAFGVILYTALQHLDSIRHGISVVFSVIAPVLYGLSLAYLINMVLVPVEKLFSFMDRRPKLHWVKRTVSITVSLILILLILSLLILVIYPQIRSAATTLLNSMPSYFRRFSVWTAKVMQNLHFNEDLIHEISLDWENISERILLYLQDSSNDLWNFAANFTSSLANKVLYTFIAFFTALQALAVKEKCYAMYQSVCRHLLPEKISGQIFHVVEISNHAFSHYFSGEIIEAILYGILVFIGMLIFRFPYPPVIAMMLAVTNLIPVAGPWIGTCIAALLVFIVAPEQALWFLVFILILQQIDNNLIYPRVVGVHIGLPDLLVLIAVVIGSAFGILGIILSVPLAAIFYTLLKESLESKKAREKEIAQTAIIKS